MGIVQSFTWEVSLGVTYFDDADIQQKVSTGPVSVSQFNSLIGSVKLVI